MRRMLTGVVLTALLAGTATGVGPLVGSAAAADRPAAGEGASEDVCHRAPVRGYGFDHYGGWKGVSLPATGRFRVAAVQGTWWFVTPDGHGLFSNGITGIDDGDPSRAGGVPYHEHVLARYGSDAAWAANTLSRLCDLDVFSLAAWTNGGVSRFAGKLAYPISASFLATAPPVPGWPAGLSGVVPRDVFDPAFPPAATAYAANDPFVQQCEGDPWCYGVFVDNELPWSAGPLATGTHLDAYASLPAGSPGKLALEWFLAVRYRGDVAAFNAAWGLDLASFDDLQARTSLTTCALGDYLTDDPCLAREPAARRADRTEFEAMVAGRYASVVRGALRTAAPSVLDLGLRFFSIYTPASVARAVAPFVDVVSVNDYDFSPANRAALRALGGSDAFPSLFSTDAFTDLGTLHALTGRPVLVGEWFYRQSRPDAGPALPPLFPEVATQQEQAARYRVYARNLARMPFAVGQHWFQWMDQPKEGRLDGENQLIGVVDIDDDLKVPLAAAMRTINSTLIQRHSRCVTRPNATGC